MVGVDGFGEFGWWLLHSSHVVIESYLMIRKQIAKDKGSRIYLICVLFFPLVQQPAFV